MSDSAQFEEFVVRVEPGLRRALIGAVGVDRVEDAVAEVIAYAFEHWVDVSEMDNPAGYLFRVGQSRSRRRRRRSRLMSVEVSNASPSTTSSTTWRQA